jgi:hypothetical protein
VAQVVQVVGKAMGYRVFRIGDLIVIGVLTGWLSAEYNAMIEARYWIGRGFRVVVVSMGELSRFTN